MNTKLLSLSLSLAASFPTNTAFGCAGVLRKPRHSEPPLTHCHLGTFQTPWHEDEDWVECPFCVEAFTRVHLVWECPGVIAEREGCLGRTLPTRVGEWSPLLGRGAARLGRFLRTVGLLIDRPV